MVGKMTTNNLVILGWKSDNESVIGTDGTVNRPAFAGSAAAVQLTPVLGMVDTMGEADGSYVTADGTPITVTVPDMGMEPLDVAKTGYIVNEDYTEALTDSTEDHAKTIIPYASTYTSGGIAGEGEIVLTSGENGAATYYPKNKGGVNLIVPFGPGTTIDAGKYTTPNMTGEFMFEFDFERLSALGTGEFDFYLRNGNGTNVAKLRIQNAAVSYEYYNASGKLETYTSTPVSGAKHKFKLLLGTENGKQYLGGLWIDGNAAKTTKQELSYKTSDGWKLLAGTLAGDWIAGELCSLDNIKVWRSAEEQAKELAAAEEGKITFDQIKGKNTSAQNVTEDLELKSGEVGGLQTGNKLLVMGWKSDQPDVISETGKVTRPSTDSAEVQLTPVLAIQDVQTGEYVTVDGAPITVTVKTSKVAMFVDKDSNEVTALSPSITQGVADISGFSGTVVLFAVLYNGSYLEQIWVSETAADGGEDLAAVNVTLPNDLNGKQLKLFVWNQGSLEPLCAPAEV